MNREYLSYGIIGIVVGLVLGFIVANQISTGTGAAAPQAAASNESKPTSVNSSNSGQALPPNHPPIDSGQTIPAPPLPSTATDTMGSASQTGTSAELPSL